MNLVQGTPLDLPPAIRFRNSDVVPSGIDPVASEISSIRHRRSGVDVAPGAQKQAEITAVGRAVLVEIPGAARGSPASQEKTEVRAAARDAALREIKERQRKAKDAKKGKK